MPFSPIAFLRGGFPYTKNRLLKKGYLSTSGVLRVVFVSVAEMNMCVSYSLGL